jgi:iron complex outermembrane receptor protein
MKTLKTRGARSRLMTMAAGVALLPFGAAHAQTAPAGGGQAQAAEIVVTAQRRSEKLVDVPLSVTAITPEVLSMAHITSTRDLGMVTPGLSIAAGGAYVQPTIRGITTNQTVPTSESNIATYVDGVYQNTMAAALYELPDVKQVEVLKGPQGTLFGRNATGGAILINTIQPNLTHFTGELSGSLGNYQNAIVKGYVSGPIIQDKLAMSLTAFNEHMGGYKQNLLADGAGIGHLDDFLFRGKIRVLPWQGADFTLTGLYTDRRDYTAVKNTNWHGNNSAVQKLPPSLIASGPYQFSSDVDPYANSKQASISLRGTIDAGPGVITSTTAYIKNTGVFTSDSDNSPLPTSYLYIPYFTKSFQQELLYTTNQLGKFHGVGGFYYFHSYGGFNPLNVNSYLQNIYTRDKDSSFAFFGEGVYDVTDRLRLTAGVRYSHEAVDANAALTLRTPIPPSSIPGLGQHTWAAWTPKASALYKISERTNAYFTYSQGFKSGVFNTVAFQTTPVNPEKVSAYEVGVKSDGIQNFSWSVAGFLYNYKDLQLPTIIQNGLVVTQQLTNAAQSQIKGVEVNGTWQLNEVLSLTGGGTYLHGRYTSYPNAVINVPTGGGGNKTIPANLSGYTMIRAPAWSGNLTGRFLKVTAKGTYDLAITAYAATKSYFDVGDRIVQPGYALVNMSLAWRPPQSGAEFKLWGKNLTNAAYIYGTTITTATDGVNYAPPRTYGVELSYSF